MKKPFIIFLFLILTKVHSQDFKNLKLFDTLNEKEAITKNVVVKKDEILLSIYVIHGYLSLTEIRHYIINTNNEVRKIKENQSRDSKLVSFEEVKIDDQEKKEFFINFKKLLHSNFLKLDPKSYSIENPKVRISCMLDPHNLTYGIALTQNNRQSNYKEYDPHNRLRFCDLVNKNSLQEFVDIYKIFRFELYKL